MGENKGACARVGPPSSGVVGGGVGRDDLPLLSLIPPPLPSCTPAAFVGGLSWSTDDNGLYEAFSRFGNIVEAKVRRGRRAAERGGRVWGPEQWPNPRGVRVGASSPRSGFSLTFAPDMVACQLTARRMARNSRLRVAAPPVHRGKRSSVSPPFRRHPIVSPGCWLPPASPVLPGRAPHCRPTASSHSPSSVWPYCARDLFFLNAPPPPQVIQDRETGRSRGFGFVTFDKSEDLDNAIAQMDGSELHGARRHAGSLDAKFVDFYLLFFCE